MAHTGFDPAVHGFPFPNRFVNTVARLPSGDTIRTSGRCGGMSYAALDVFHSGRTAPTRTWADQPRRVPPDGTAIADHLARRQLDSFREPSAVRFLAWTLLPDERSLLFRGVSGWTAAEVPKVRAALDAGEPVVLGMVGARALRDVGRRNHQVVAIGYRTIPGGVTFDLYDPNTPGRTVQLAWTKRSGALVASNRRDPWRGFFLHTYVPDRPPAAMWG